MDDANTPEKIKARVKERLSTTLETREGSFVDDLLGPVALELYRMYTSQDGFESVVWVDATSGPYLDSAAADIGLEPRKEGSKAEVMLQITGKHGTILTEKKQFQTKEGLGFTLQQPAIIPENGELSIKAEAIAVGNHYNVDVGTICLQYDNLLGVESVINPESAQGGTDPESDTSFFSRIELFRKNPASSGSSADYIHWATEVKGVGFARVIPCWNGPGTVKVMIAGTDLLPVDPTVVERCKEHIEKKRPILAEITVVSLNPKQISISASIKSDTSIEAVAKAYLILLQQFFTGILLQRTEVILNKVGSLLMEVEGVKDYSDLLLCGQAKNLQIGPEEIPVTGEIVLREMK